MYQIFSLSKQEQTEIFKEAAARSTQIKSPIIIEKDLWVCWALERIFNLQELQPHITFKGGTSLSKCYNIINRFSEDCDLTLSKEFLGIEEEAEVIFNKGRKQRDKFIKKLVTSAIRTISTTIKPKLTEQFQLHLSESYSAGSWRIEVDNNDQQSLLFHYPSVIPFTENNYVRSAIKLEFGARGDTNPNETRNITPYVYEILPVMFTKTPSIGVQTLTAKRTFWEKATLLHAEHYRKLDKPLQNRMFRHYYDIVMLDNNGISDLALDDPQLLDIVLMNKKMYFSSSSANYDTAKIGNLHLLPNSNFMETLRQDCIKMSEMFFGSLPIFDEVMTRIEILENKINLGHDYVCANR